MDAQTVKKNFGFDVSDLSEASVEEVGTQPVELHFDRGEYADFEQVKWNLRDLSSRPVTKKPSSLTRSLHSSPLRSHLYVLSA